MQHIQCLIICKVHNHIKLGNYIYLVLCINTVIIRIWAIDAIDINEVKFRFNSKKGIRHIDLIMSKSSIKNRETRALEDRSDYRIQASDVSGTK